MKSVYIIHGSQQYRQLFERLGFVMAEHLAEADLVCFTGGEDVSPYMYEHQKHKATWNNPARDQFEVRLFDQAQALGIPCVGICRGGQFLNVVSGGEMYQDVSGHALYDGHMLTDVESGETIYVSSTHHQMFKPSKDAIIVAVSSLGGTREWWNGQMFARDVSNTDYEVVYYPHTNSLCFQPHPEFGNPEYDEMKKYFEQCLSKYLGV